jgi:hypothetical protein
MTRRGSIAPPTPSKGEGKRRQRRHDPCVRELAISQEGWGEERSLATVPVTADILASLERQPPTSSPRAAEGWLR